MTDFTLSRQDALSVRADAVVFFCAEGGNAPEGQAPGKLQKVLKDLMKRERFSGEEGEILTWHAPAGSPSPRYVVVGTGKEEDFNLETVRRVFAALARRLEKTARHLAATLPGGKRRHPDIDERLQAAVEGIALGRYRWDPYMTSPNGPAGKKPLLQKVSLLAPTGAEASRALRRGQVYSEATVLARELTCEAPSVMTPREMERRARQVARKNGLTITVLNETQAARKGMGCFLGVARGAAEPPRVIHLVYKPPVRKGRKRRRVVLVGKGVTFDSGGLSLKPAVSMENMKCDMAGSAAVLGTLAALKRLGCSHEVHGILMMTENMPSGSAYKPGDILRSMRGKTVEIVNTDAEGRLALADGLELARSLKPDHVIDIATLTGACVVGLGTLCSGIMGYDKDMIQDVLQAAEAAGEPMWPLPFIKEYRELLNSKVADIKHVGGRWGGAITAGMFLGEFMGKETPWVHIDVAGPAFAEEDQSLSRVGGTGHPVRTLLRYLERLS